MQQLRELIDHRGSDDLSPLDPQAAPHDLRPLILSINGLMERLSASVRAQRRFIADAAHELRSPMTAMSLQAERLAATEMPCEARARLDALSAGLARTRILLDQLLTLARSQEGGGEPLTQVPLQKAIQEAFEDLVPLAEAKAIDLGMVGDADASVTGRTMDIRILVKNLVDNAIRYTPEGGRIDIRVTAASDRIVLDVDDTGPGIVPAERERVFDPFYRVLGSGEIGSGLGLAITASIVDRIGATISLLDRPDGERGLRARVIFPAGVHGQAGPRRTTSSA
jgi:two-component system OmpR family sensor kinase